MTLCLGQKPYTCPSSPKRQLVIHLFLSLLPEQQLPHPNQIEQPPQLTQEPRWDVQARRLSRALFLSRLSAGGVPRCLYLETEHLQIKNRINDIFVQHRKTMAWEHCSPVPHRFPATCHFQALESISCVSKNSFCWDPYRGHEIYPFH